MTDAVTKSNSPRVDFLKCTSAGVLYYCLTSLVAVLGVAFGHDFVNVARLNPLSNRKDCLAAFANWDGGSYVRILIEGYKKPDTGQPQETPFFPAYPLLGRCLVWATGLRPELALLIVSHLCLAAAFVVAFAYVRLRFPDPSDAVLPGFVLLSLGLFPPGCFFRMAYTESPFLLLMILVFYGMERQWPLLLIALLAGAASSVRAVGLALVPAFALHLWHRSPRLASFAVRGTVLGPLACWGILAYMLYQEMAFGDPLVFYRSEMAFRARPEESVGNKLFSDLTLEPILSVFDPSDPGYWMRVDFQWNPLFSLPLANPLFVVAAIVVLGFGIREHCLTGPEITAAFFLLLIPYVSKGGALYMTAQARFVAVVFPLYIVLGRLLARLPAPLLAAFAALSAFFLGAYAALFAAWHAIY